MEGESHAGTPGGNAAATSRVRAAVAAGDVRASTPGLFDTATPAGSSAGATSPKVVAVVLNWNGTDDTVRCVRTLAGVAYDNLEILVIDNGSRVGPAAALLAAGLGVPILYTPRNLGYAGGNNVGMEWAAARGARFVWILNNDTEIDPGALAPLVEAAGRYPKAGVFGSRITRGDDPSRIWVAWGRVTWRQSLIALDGESEKDGPRFDGEHEVEWIPGCSLLFRAEALAEVGGFDEDFFAYHEDVDWAARARALGWTSVYVGASRLTHHIHGSSGGSSFYGGFRKYLSARNSALYALRHGNWGQVLFFTLAILLTFPFQLLRRALSGEAAGVWIKLRGWLDALAGRPIPFAELGLRDPADRAEERRPLDGATERRPPDDAAERRSSDETAGHPPA